MFALSNNPINPRMSSSFNRKRLAAEDPGSWGEISSAAKRLHLDQLIQKLSLYESVSASDNAPSLDACHEVDMDIRTEEQKKHVLWISDLAEELKQADEEERRNLLEKYPRLWSLTQAVDTRQQDQKPDLLQMPSSISASEPPPLPPLPFEYVNCNIYVKLTHVFILFSLAPF